jgi:hypothetical protein
VTFAGFYDAVALRMTPGATWQISVHAWGDGKGKVTWEIYVAETPERPCLTMSPGCSSPEEALARLDGHLGHARKTTVEEVGP